MIKIAIVDDDKNERDIIAEMTEFYFKKTGRLDFNIDRFGDGIDLLKEYRPIYDIIFLDIEMNLLDGMNTAKKIRELDEKAVIIFITRMAQYAVKGYEVDAIGFIVKPVKYSVFEMYLKKALHAAELGRNENITIQSDYKQIVLSLRDIVYIESAGHDVFFYTSKGEYRTYGTLKSYAEKLRDKHFRLCNQSYLINVSHITDISQTEVTVGDTVLPLSRSKRKELLLAVADYFGTI